MIARIQKLKNKKGFTLVELIVVIAIIAILTAVLIPVIGNYTATAAQTAVQQAAGEVKTSVSTVLSSAATKGVITADCEIEIEGNGTGVAPTITCNTSGVTLDATNVTTPLETALMSLADGDVATCTITSNACVSVSYANAAGSITASV